jgi:sugar lactone lactonase YvrE
MSAMEVIDGGSAWYRSNPANKLGESPIYRASDSTLHWVDVYADPCTIHILAIDPTTGDAVGLARILEVPFDAITVIRFRKDVVGSYVCGYRQGIALLDEKTGEVTVLKKLIEDEGRESMTMNDGGVDPQGRFWIGEVDLTGLRTYLRDKLPEGYESRGNLWRYEKDGTCTVMETGIMCGNGIGWSPDGKHSKWNGTEQRCITKHAKLTCKQCSSMTRERR